MSDARTYPTSPAQRRSAVQQRKNAALQTHVSVCVGGGRSIASCRLRVYDLPSYLLRLIASTEWCTPSWGEPVVSPRQWSVVAATSVNVSVRTNRLQRQTPLLWLSIYSDLQSSVAQPIRHWTILENRSAAGDPVRAVRDLFLLAHGTSHRDSCSNRCMQRWPCISWRPVTNASDAHWCTAYDICQLWCRNRAYT